MGNFFKNLLGSAIDDLLKGTDGNVGLLGVLGYIFAVAGLASLAYAIWLGFMLAKAEDAGKRQKAKKRIFNVVAGLIIIVILSALLMNPGWVGYGSDRDTEGDGNGGIVGTPGYSLSVGGRSVIYVDENVRLYLYKDGYAVTNVVFYVTPESYVNFDRAINSIKAKAEGLNKTITIRGVHYDAQDNIVGSSEKTVTIKAVEP